MPLGQPEAQHLFHQRPEADSLLAAEEGRSRIDFGSSHSTDVSDAITAAVAAFLRSDPEVFFAVAVSHQRNSTIAWGLYGWHEPRAVRYLVDCLAAEPWPTRWSAARALGSQGDVTVAHKLAPLLNDPDQLVRGAAIDSLGMIAGQDAMLALSSFVHSPVSTSSPTEVARAKQVLERLRHTEFLDAAASPDTIADRLTQGFRSWAESNGPLRDAVAQLSTRPRYVLDTDLLWRASGKPSVTRSLLFDPTHRNWRDVFGGGSPWISATLMQTEQGEAVIALAVQSPANAVGGGVAFDHVALALSYEPKALELR